MSMLESIHAAIDCEGHNGCPEFAVFMRPLPVASIGETLREAAGNHPLQMGIWPPVAP